MTRIKTIVARWVLRAYFENATGFRAAYFEREQAILRRMSLKSLWKSGELRNEKGRWFKKIIHQDGAKVL